jgi:predicted DsbA family dithiol-disulfide isomerase
MTHLTIDIFSDIVCPWCLIGTRRLSQVLSAWETPLEATIQHHPFFLDPTTPSGGVDLQQMLKRKYGAEPRSMFGHVEAAARETGIDLHLEKQRFIYPTLRAHTLIRRAASRGTQLALVDALFTAYFIDAKNVEDIDVLADVASLHGFSKEEARALLGDEAELESTRAEAIEATELGIRGVPFFVFNGELSVSGAQRPEVFRQAIRQSMRVA